MVPHSVFQIPQDHSLTFHHGVGVHEHRDRIRPVLRSQPSSWARGLAVTVTTVPGINQAFNTCQALDGASQVALVVKNLPTDAGELRDAGSFPGSQSQVNDFSLGGEDPLKESMATHSTILASRIPRTEEPRGLGCKESEAT